MKNTNIDTKRLDILDLMRGIAIMMVVFYHAMEVVFGPVFLIVPDGVTANWNRIAIFRSGAWWNWLENIFSALFAYGFASVNVFVVLSGLVLTWGNVKMESIERKAQSEKWGGVLGFYGKKLRRILVPFYIAALIGFLLLAFRNWYFPALNWWPNYGWFDWVKYVLPPWLVFDVHWIQQLEGNYWYITLILQLYLIFPILYWLSKKVGVKNFLVITFLLTFAYRLMATFGYQWLKPWIDVPYLDSSPMGVIAPNQNSYFGFSFFLPRLAEFALGMALAYWQFGKEKILDKLVGGRWGGVKMVGFWVVAGAGFALDSVQAGWIISDLVIAIGLFGLLLNISNYLQRWSWAEITVRFLGNYSFEIYLVHGFWLAFVCSPFLNSWDLKNEAGFWLFLPVFWLLIILSAVLNRKIEKKLAI